IGVFSSRTNRRTGIAEPGEYSPRPRKLPRASLTATSSPAAAPPSQRSIDRGFFVADEQAHRNRRTRGIQPAAEEVAARVFDGDFVPGGGTSLSTIDRSGFFRRGRTGAPESPNPGNTARGRGSCRARL